MQFYFFVRLDQVISIIKINALQFQHNEVDLLQFTAVHAAGAQFTDKCCLYVRQKKCTQKTRPAPQLAAEHKSQRRNNLFHLKETL